MPPDSEQAAMMPTQTSAFLRRVLSFVVLWAVMLAALLSDSEVIGVFVLLALLVTVIWAGLAEFFGLSEKQGWKCFKGWALAAATLLIVGDFVIFTGWLDGDRSLSAVNDFEAAMLVLFVLGLCARHLLDRSDHAGIVPVSISLFGVMYVAWLLNFMQKIYFFPGIMPHGRHFVFYLIAVTKFSDTGAYIVGAVVGKRQMAPSISAGKTWEGFAGAILASIITSIAFAHLAGDRLAGMTSLHAAGLGVVLGLAAVAGDLTESLFKRRAGVKDSGALFPGIGGVLDLIDSLLFTAPVLYLYLRFGGMLQSS